MTITREEAIVMLKSKMDGSVDNSYEWVETIRMAIKALSEPSGDLISRSDAIRWVKTECNPYSLPTLDYDSGLKVIEHLVKMPSAPSSSEAIQKWVPCSEELPKEREWVGTKKFGTTISDEVHITFDVNDERFVKTLSLQNGELSNYEKRTMDTFYKGWKMIAWMPMPEPYREDEELATEQMEHDDRYEPTYNSEDGSG